MSQYSNLHLPTGFLALNLDKVSTCTSYGISRGQLTKFTYEGLWSVTDHFMSFVIVDVVGNTQPF